MDSKVGMWERNAEIPLMFAAFVFLAAFAVPIIWWPNTPESLVQVCEALVWITWVVFALDFLVRLLLSAGRFAFVRRHWFDLLVIALPVLRPLRLLRLVTLLTLVNRRASADLRGRVGMYVAGGSLLLAVVGALAVVDVEREAADANITTLGDAFWWAATTMTTVGYGDRYPVTPEPSTSEGVTTHGLVNVRYWAMRAMSRPSLASDASGAIPSDNGRRQLDSIALVGG